jgi:hypothetical protein
VSDRPRSTCSPTTGSRARRATRSPVGISQPYLFRLFRTKINVVAAMDLLDAEEPWAKKLLAACAE